jgi:hypothetical protein
VFRRVVAELSELVIDIVQRGIIVRLFGLLATPQLVIGLSGLFDFLWPFEFNDARRKYACLDVKNGAEELARAFG